MDPAVDRKVSGIVAATFTPFNPDGHINPAVIGPYVDYLTKKQGVTNVFVNGTTGESVSLSMEERKVLAEVWCREGKGKLDQLIVHVGCMSLKDTQELARHAEEIGADGIAVISPSFFKPSTADALREYLKQVAKVAPTLPFYYYHIPAMTGINVNARDVVEGIEQLIPSFRGLKFSGTDLMDFGQCVRLSQPNWSLLYGVDEQLLAGLAMGAEGAVGSTFNYMGCHTKQLITAFKAGDLSQCRSTVICCVLLLFTGFNLGVNKQLMIEVSGLSLGPPRLPLLQCPADNSQAIAKKYHSLFPDP
uniref:N-acetylneuraminate lyase n=1 Tax=Myripristis murdjan TaxID=586833 RepID=A0A667XUX0_9TELE